MRILLLGATGRTGRHVLTETLFLGHTVHVLARKSERISSHENLRIFEGDVLNLEDLERAIDGCDHVISCLNVSRHSDFPWAKLRTPPTLMSDVTRLLTQLSNHHPIKRLVFCSAWGVAETRSEIPNWFRWFIDNSNIGVAYKDHERQEILLEESKLNWTIVRPVGLTNGKKKEVRESYNKKPKPSLTISRKSLASYLISSLASADKIHHKVVVSH